MQKKATQHSYVAGEILDSHRQIQRAERPCRNLHGFNEAFGMQISLVAPHKLAGGLNPRFSTFLDVSCVTLCREILILTTEVCFDSHAFRWAENELPIFTT